MTEKQEQVVQFGQTAASRQHAHLISISTTTSGGAGCSVQVSSYGAAIVSCWVPDRAGGLADVALGFESLEGYESNPSYLGVTVGRVAGRIGNGQFKSPDGDKVYQLTRNFQGRHCLHGGTLGLSHVMWSVVEVSRNHVKLEHTSPDGADGFPGALHATVQYILTSGGDLSPDDVRLTIVYAAELQSQPTVVCPVNLTNHACWNLAGHNAGREQIARHLVKIRSRRCLELDEISLLPTGNIFSLEPKISRYLGELRSLDQFMPADRDPTETGVDAYYVLNAETSGENEPAAVVIHPPSGRKMTVHTDQPGLVFYTGNYLNPTSDPPGKGGRAYEPQSGFCLEAMGYPDACSHANFPSILLRSGETYRQTTSYVFSVCGDSCVHYC